MESRSVSSGGPNDFGWLVVALVLPSLNSVTCETKRLSRQSSFWSVNVNVGCPTLLVREIHALSLEGSITMLASEMLEAIVVE